MAARIAGETEDGGAAEAVVDPLLPVVDAHFHLWNAAGYDYFVQDFLADVRSGHRVEASIFVECGMAHRSDGSEALRPVGETHYVLDQIRQGGATDHDVAAGILGAADMTLGAGIRPVLAAHVEAGAGRFRGIRARLAYDPDPQAGYGHAFGYYERDVLAEASVLAAARCIGASGLVLDLWAFHTQLEAVAAFAARCPETPVMLDHCGGPLGVGRYAGRRDEVFRDWAAGIRTLAKVPNVHVKLSGLGISRLGFGYQTSGPVRSSDELVAAWRPYIRTCVEAFGPERCVFGSNFSVDRAAAPYRLVLNAYQTMLADLTDAERRAIFAGNARRFYKLG
jgi:L-fuconolactonase